jgi:hypothetical protein
MQRRYHNNKKSANASTTSPISSIKLWIEKLLETPISDYRKTARDLILIPYLIVDKDMTDKDKIYDIVMAWADRCDRLRGLEPSRHDFSSRVRSRIDQVIRDRVPPMRLETVRENYLQLYRTLDLGRFD